MLRSANEDTKRSIATLAKNGQLPSREPEPDDTSSSQWLDEKRNIGSLARSGIMNSGKRNVASLARAYELPSYGGNSGKRNLASIVRASGTTRASNYKRNMAALARSNALPLYYDEIKRNVGALARDWSLPTSKVTMKWDARDDDQCMYFI